jgi:hypothetical protein
MAMERYGNSITVCGTTAFKEQIAQAAAAAQLTLTLTTPPRSVVVNNYCTYAIILRIRSDTMIDKSTDDKSSEPCWRSINRSGKRPTPRTRRNSPRGRAAHPAPHWPPWTHPAALRPRSFAQPV